MSDQANLEPAAPPARRGSLAVALIPLAVFAALAFIFYIGLFRGDPTNLPSALIGKPAPEFDLAPLEGLLDGEDQVPGLSTADLKKGRVSVVNVWASWCGPCRLEHPYLLRLAEDSEIDLVAINYKDAPGNARRFIGLLGNPYKAVGADTTGRVAIDWGVHGVPETFIVDGSGTVVYKHIGPIGPTVLEEKVWPAIARAKAR